MVSCSGTTGTEPKPNTTNELEEPVVTTGTLEITISTGGETPDEDGYELSLDGANAQAVGADDTFTFSDLEEGTYELQLDGVAANCSVDGGNPVEVSIMAEETTSVDLEVICEYALKDKVVLSSDTDGDYELYIIDTDGSNLQQLTDNSVDDIAPTVSPDGRFITFSRGSLYDATANLFVMNADGSRERQLTDNTGANLLAQWSSDGSEIIYNGMLDGDGDIYRMAIDGSQNEKIKDNPFEDAVTGWLHDSNKLLIQSDRDGDMEIYITNMDGSDPKQLTENTTRDDMTTIRDMTPIPSPDGKKIAFASNRDGDFEIFTMNIDGSNVQQLTVNSVYDQLPVWSSDGKQLLFTSIRDGDYELFLINADGGAIINQLTINDRDDIYPAWSPLQ